MALVSAVGPRSETVAPPAAARAAVELRGIGHAYRAEAGPTQALATIDLTIEAGAFVAMLGPSGCGKTTLLRILSGLLAASHGQVRLAGDVPAAARARRAIGWLAQDDGLLPWRRVADNVRLPLQLSGRAEPGAELEMLRRVGLEGSARQYPHELSGGMRQRAALARALVARPPFVLLDEPFAHLDELTRERLGDLLLELRLAAGRPRPTTILVTHSVHEAVRLADRVIVLSARPGRVVADVAVDLERPRADDQPGFGRLVRGLKRVLGVTPGVTAGVTPLSPADTPVTPSVTPAPPFCDARMTLA